MTESTLEVAVAKYLAPPIPQRYIPRPRLDAALDRGTDVPLTTVVAPPGSGKTVAVASWLTHGPDASTVWMSCDGRDADAATFWRSLAGGLARRWSHRWVDVRDLLDDGEPDLERVAIATVNELQTLDGPVIIVIDDFHLARAAHPSMQVALEGLPAHAHLVVIGRADPAFPLHRLRVRNELVELREEQLRLSPDETTDLADVLGLGLDGDSSRLLHDRTDGWLAAVHLAAVSLRDRENAHDFLATFSGENRLVAEFLLGEVLDRQPPQIRRFLEDSSVLDELDPPACRAVTGMTESADLLRTLSLDNMLVSPAGDGLTFRYHQLFRDLLQYELKAKSPERFAALHKIAAEWYLSRAEYDRAAAHLTVAGDDDAAYALLRNRAVDVVLDGGPRAMERVVSVLDLKRAADVPERAVDVAFSLAVAGLVKEAKRWIERVKTMPVELAPSTKHRLAIARSFVLGLEGDPRASLAAMPQDPDLALDDPSITFVPTIEIYARLWIDDFAGVRSMCDAPSPVGLGALEVTDVLFASVLAYTACVEGSLREADDLARDALQRAERYGTQLHPMTFGALWARARTLFETGRFDEAAAHFERSIAVTERNRPPMTMLGIAGLARLWIAEGRFVDATIALDQARALMPVGKPGPLIDLMTACDVKLALAMRDLDRAENLLTKMSPSDRRDRLAAALALARDQPADALIALDRVCPFTLRQRLDTALLRARSSHALRRPEANALVDECITLAGEQGFVVALADELRDLATRLSSRLRARPLDDFGRAVLERLDRPRALSSDSNGRADLVEQLSDRERTVLRYLDSRLTLREIASECYLSANTVKTHTKAVYRKLGVSSRQEAIAEGRRLQLI